MDADLTLITGFGREAPYVDALLGAFRGRIEDARGFALLRRVLLLEAANGIPLDISLGAIAYEERVVARSSAFPIEPGAALVTCSAEDLIVLKAVAGREQDWLDIRGVAARQADRLEKPLIERELQPLVDLKGDPDAAARVRQMLERR